MSVYATVANPIDDSNYEWFISVAVFPVEEPVRINHGDGEWYMSERDARRLWEALNKLFLTRDNELTERLAVDVAYVEHRGDQTT